MATDQVLLTLTTQLQTLKLTIATAESCTGGLISARLTDFPGSSAWFERGFITYSNAAKEELLGVDAALIERFGAVSIPVAEAMASGALLHSHADVALAVTGIAGPDGGSAEKPVGLVCFAFAKRHGLMQSYQHLFPANSSREQIRQASCTVALQGMIDLLA